jgi:hypothetical protein
VHRLEAAFVADLKLHDTAKGTLLAVEALRGKDDLDLLDQAEGATARLLAAGLDRFRAPRVERVRSGATPGAPARRYYLEARLGRRVDGGAPMALWGGSTPEYPAVLAARVGRRLDRRWAIELGVGSGEAWGRSWPTSVGRFMSSEAQWITAGAVWRAPPGAPFSYLSAAADVGVALVHAEFRPIVGVHAPAGTAPSTIDVAAPTGGLEARLDVPVGPVSIGLRAGGVFMWSEERAANPGNPAEDWLVPGVFQLWSVSAAVQWALPF